MTKTYRSIEDSELFRMGEKVDLIVPPKIEAMLTGVNWIYCKNDSYMLAYADGTFEEGCCKNMPQDFIGMVSKIQSLRNQ